MNKKKRKRKKKVAIFSVLFDCYRYWANGKYHDFLFLRNAKYLWLAEQSVMWSLGDRNHMCATLWIIIMDRVGE